MPRGFSVYLDLFRLTAALTVLLFHVTYSRIGGGAEYGDGPEAVLAFFVLSGFVIAHVAERRERDGIVFVTSRLSRLWSVLLPALLLTPLCDAVGRAVDPAFYVGWEPALGFDHPVARLAAAGLFVNQIGFWSIAPLSNAPLWSLGYEFWYYMLFAAAVFLRGRRRWLVAIAIALFVGPKVLLLLPPWLFGVALYRWRERIPRSQWLAALLFLGGGCFVIGGSTLQWPNLLREETYHLFGRQAVDSHLWTSRDFIWDNLVGLAVMAHLAGAYRLFARTDLAGPRADARIRAASHHTYSIYVLHHPILMMLAAIMGTSLAAGPVRIALLFVGSFAICVALGRKLEPLRYLLRSALLRLATGMAPDARSMRHEIHQHEADRHRDAAHHRDEPELHRADVRFRSVHGRLRRLS